jgi:hypothetical protein
MKKSFFQDLTNVLKLQTIKKEKVNNVLDIKICNHKNHNNDGISKNSRRRFSLPRKRPPAVINFEMILLYGQNNSIF